jgi:hypothetical protein
MSLAPVFGWHFYQIDVKTAFFNGLIDEDVYINQPKGFEAHGHETHVCRLKKALYGLKQAPCAWYSRIDEYLLALDFSKTDTDSNLHYSVDDSNLLVLVLYVDNLILTGSLEKLIARCKAELAREFDINHIN